jgi:transcriptional regulator with XRE-family HTH domain
MARRNGGAASGPLALFCTRLKRLQQAAGITQASLAATAHLGTSQMSDILNGKIKQPPDWDLTARIIRACMQHAEGKAKSVPTDLRDEADWRRRHADLEHDLEASGRPDRETSYQTGGVPYPVARSAYLEQVRRIAPPDPPGLMGRDAELAELARFCLVPNGPSYAWWRAGPWAGKSALLSSFVLRPPPEVVAGRVRLVSFFITARLAAQDTRGAFTQVLAEQLAALLGQSLPTVLPEATREAYLLDLMSQAAGKFKDASGRLVLVIDGLDEDRGVTTGPDAHSIAGLLPADPPTGMRVIVAGRPNPPIPDDVPDWHPLRDPAIIRPLVASPHAQDVQRLGRQELQRLLHGSTVEQDLLGLLTAARGGLTGPDLAELADIPLWEAEDTLRTAAGRTFSSRPSLNSPGKRQDVYLLGHEELQAAATHYLRRRLAAHHERLHAWAEDYRARRWPADTPEYLLSGYFRLWKTLATCPG